MLCSVYPTLAPITTSVQFLKDFLEARRVNWGTLSFSDKSCLQNRTILLTLRAITSPLQITLDNLSSCFSRKIEFLDDLDAWIVCAIHCNKSFSFAYKLCWSQEHPLAYTMTVLEGTITGAPVGTINYMFKPVEPFRKQLKSGIRFFLHSVAEELKLVWCLWFWRGLSWSVYGTNWPGQNHVQNFGWEIFSLVTYMVINGTFYWFVSI